MRLIDADALANIIETDCPVLNFAALLSKGWVLSLIRDKANTPTVGGWISVNDRLPDKDGKYLVASLWILDGKYHVETARYAKNLNDVWMDWKSGSGWWNGDSESDWEETDVKYWMPMPEPPKGSDTDGCVRD